MFQTSKNMQLRLPVNIAPHGYQQWHTVTQTLPVRWFHVRYACIESHAEQILMTGDLDIVENINNDSTLNLFDVSLASPPQLNGTAGWLLSSLRSVITLVRPRDDMEQLLGYEYRLDSGRSMIERIGGHYKLDCPEIQRSEMVIRCNPPMLSTKYPH
jgi:hypothetical protein